MLRAKHEWTLPLTVTAMLVLIPLAILLSTVVVLGWQLQVVETGSMAPLYPQGSLAVVQPLDPSEVQPGMAIVFQDRLKGGLVLHRVVGREPLQPSAWRTRGDANRSDDPLPVQARDIRGKIRWAVPHLGQVGAWLRGGHTPWVLVGIPVLLLAFSEGRALWLRGNTSGVANDPESSTLPAVRGSGTGWP